MIPAGDTLPRYVCRACGTIHYRNPKLVVGCIVEWEQRILLCRRAIEPRKGYWTAPAGFMENDETTAEGARRETLEEAMAEVEALAPLALVDVPRINQVHLLFRGRLKDGDFGVGTESEATELYAEEMIPWREIAFPSVYFSLECYFSDRRSGTSGFHTTRVDKKLV
jgi:ADP-ribose pyrophosphatase YjhB (NUDIX family)